jgi:tetratricopeptide (TPR) repeat protein
MIRIEPFKRRINRPAKNQLKADEKGKNFWDSPRFHISHIIIALFAGLVGAVLAVIIPKHVDGLIDASSANPKRILTLEPTLVFGVILVALSVVLGTFIRTLRAKVVVGAKLSWAYAKLLLALAIIFLTILIVNRLSEKTEGVSILPFDNDTGESKYNGDAVAGSLKVELLRIEEILSTSHKDIPSESSERMRSTPITESGEKLNENLKDIGTVGVGEAKLSIGALLLAAKRLWPFGDPGIVISGSIQKFGKQMRLVAFLEHQHEVQGFEVTDEIQLDDAVPKLIRNMAFKIAKSLGDPAQPISAKTFEAFQNFTEGLNCYDHFVTTNDISQLREAKSFCMTAVKAEQGYDKMVSLLKNLGVYFYQRSEFKESAELFEKATTLNPSDLDAWSYLGIALAEIGELGAAERALEKARELEDPNAANFDYYINLGYALYRVNNYSEAAKQYDAAIKLNDQTALGHVGLGDCLLMEGDHFRASQEFEKALTCDSNSVDANIRVGDMNFENGRYDVALSKYNEALKIDKRSANAICSIGDVYKAQNEFDLAIRYYNEAEQIAPQNSYSHVGLGNCFVAKADYEQAAKELKWAMEVDPRNAGVHYAVGYVYFSRGEYEAAMKEFQRAIELRPKYIDPRIGMADIYRIRGDYSDAEEECREALEYWEANPYAHSCRARIFLDQWQTIDALAEYQKVIDLRPAMPDGYNGRGDAFEQQAAHQNALDEYGRALERDPDDYDAHCGKGDVFVNTGKFTQSAAEFKRASEIYPGAPRAYIGLGDVYSAQGRYELAEEEFDRAKGVDPGDAWVNARLGDMAERKKDYEQARAKYAAACESSALPVYAWTELAWLNLRTRTFAKAKYYLDRASEIRPQYSNTGLAAGAFIYLQGHVRDAERIWKTKLSECRFDLPSEKLDRIIIMYAIGDQQGAKDALKNWMQENQESPTGTLVDSVYYVDILSAADLHRFSALRDMLLSASRPVGPR